MSHGLLPAPLLASLDSLVDRLNSAHHAQNAAAAVAAASPPSPPPPVRVILVGTNEGVPLSRSYGSVPPYGAPSPQQHQYHQYHHHNPHPMSEEVLSSVETHWATLPSSSPPHAMAAAQAAAAAAAAANGGGTEGGGDPSPSPQPPHPLLGPLRLGGEVRTATAFFDGCTLIHVHMSPLVVTIIATPQANVGAVRSAALPLLRSLLAPIRDALVLSRRRALSGAAGGSASAPASGVDGTAAVVRPVAVVGGIAPPVAGYPGGGMAVQPQGMQYYQGR